MCKHGVALVFFCLFHAALLAEPVISPSKRTPQQLYVNAVEAHQLKKAQPEQVFFVDVRTKAELEFVGVPDLIDANIPYIFNDYHQWDDASHRFKKSFNSSFVTDFKAKLTQAGLDKNSTIILMCRSGQRSAKAARLLHKLDYAKVYSVVDGFEGDAIKTGKNRGKRVLNGWKNAGLPWSYQLEKEKMYIHH